MSAIALTGAAIVVVAALFAWWMARKHSLEQDNLVKAVMFGLYFWGMVFLQLIVAALVHRFLLQP